MHASTDQRKKIGIDPLSMDERKRQIFAVDGSNGTEFTSGIFW